MMPFFYLDVHACTVYCFSDCDGSACCVCFQECPSGVVNEDTFKEIYAQFFPQGGECHVQESVSFTVPCILVLCAGNVNAT